MAISKKLLLINPMPQQRYGLAAAPDRPFPPLNLAMIAALTPSGWDIQILDENFDRFQNQTADLVGITAFTATVTRAYEIAAACRQRGIPTVLGGIHASLMPAEAKKYMTTIVIGEAESVWPGLIHDFEQGCLAEAYVGPPTNLQQLPLPRRDLLSPRYTISTIQTSRGCPLDCDFCSVPAFNGKKYRRRPIAEVLDEMETLPHSLMHIIDDNLYGFSRSDVQHAIDLFKGMIKRRIKKDWSSSISVNVAGDEEFLYYARQSGCRLLTLGIEAEDMEALRLMNKKANEILTPAAYPDLLRQINRFGIATASSFIYGNDSDTPAKLEQRTRYLEDSPINAIIGTVYLTPLPGTHLFERLQKQNRLRYQNFPQDWERYDLTEVVFYPKHMTPEELKRFVLDSFRRLFSWKTIGKRFFRTWLSTRSLVTTIWAFLMNYRIRQITSYILKAENALAKPSWRSGSKAAKLEN